MSKIGDKWKKLADRKIYLNNRLEISVGRLIFLSIVAVFGWAGFPILWILPFLSVNIKKKEEDD